MSTNSAYRGTLVPKVFDARGINKYYVLPVNFRGEMYHVRAAMAVEPLPLILVGYTATTKNDGNVEQLVDYLSSLANKSGQDVFLTPWSIDDLTNLTNKKLSPEDTKGCRLWLAGKTENFEDFEDHTNYGPRGAIHEKEYNATEYIKHNIADIATITQKMSYLEDHAVTLIDKIFEENERNIATAIFPSLQDGKSERVLVLHRDSGAKSGVYPEYDSGGALHELREMLQAIRETRVPSRRLVAVICGDIPNTAQQPSTGAYWLKLAKLLEKLKPELAMTKTKIPQRAFEAYFFQWAHKTGRFSMTVGFRSGVLDMFTFLGIPTVSIALRYGVGELRHGMLAVPALQRLNIQYDLPRHKATAWRKSRTAVMTLPERLVESFESPYWKSDPPLQVAARHLSVPEQQKLQGVEPSGFHIFDKAIVDIGLRVACSKLLKWTPTVSRVVQQPYEDIITAEALRESMALYLPMAKRDDYRKAVKKNDQIQLEQRKTMLKDLQEAEDVYKYYLSQSQT